MRGYLIALMKQTSDKHWRDTEYGPTFSRLLQKYGGTMTMATDYEQVEGEPLAEPRIAIFEFPNMEAARSFWNDPEYQRVAPIRRPLGQFQILLAEGLETPTDTPHRQRPA